MARNTKSKVAIPGWHIHDTGYFTTMINGKEHTNRFKNVAITENENFDKSDMIIWFRVWKETEEQDMFRVKLIANAPAMYNALKQKFPK